MTSLSKFQHPEDTLLNITSEHTRQPLVPHLITSPGIPSCARLPQTSLNLNSVLRGRNSRSWSRWLSNSWRSRRIDLLNSRSLRVLSRSYTSILSEVKIQATILQLRNQEQDRKSEERHCEQIQDTDIDKARSDGNDITTIIDTPCDGVQEPEEHEIAG